jgi:ABC-type polysaccharide/polyol phosphate transport system ATPase subunit
MDCIQTQGVSKRYRLYRRPSDRLKEILLRSPRHREFWALRDVDFSVARGECLGVIGENGAGKTTLLSLILGVGKPTSGVLRVHGRVLGVLELGVGFHPELSGRENARLYGALHGFARGEIDAQLGAIRDFSELGAFFDLPLKTYSSGMVARLAFSIATAFDPDVLVIDEALSVGDIHFQKKSFDRILSFKARGKTILFCSHSLYHVLHLCEKALWLKEGRIAFFGEAARAVELYENDIAVKNGPLAHPAPRSTEGPAWIESYAFNKKYFATGEPLLLKIRMASRAATRVHLAVGLGRSDHTVCYMTSTEEEGMAPLDLCGIREVGFHVPGLPLLSGEYFFGIAIFDETANIAYDKLWTEHILVARGSKEMGLFRLGHRWHMGD